MNVELIINAVERLSSIPFFPTSEAARLEIMERLRSIIGTEEVYVSSPEHRLEWLIDNAIESMRQWGGIPELRGLYCQKWKPADGKETYSTIPGFTAEDSEMASAREVFERQLGPGKGLRLLEVPEPERVTDGELRPGTARYLVEPAEFPAPKPANRRPLSEDEREVQEAASRPTLTEAEKARRLETLRAGLGLDAV